MEPKDQARPEFSAMREALEEGGAIGRLGRCLGTFDNTERRHRTKVFVLHVNRLTLVRCRLLVLSKVPRQYTVDQLHHPPPVPLALH